MALERGLVEPPGAGMGPRRAWSRRQSWVNPCPLKGDSGVLTVQATALKPTYPRGVAHYRQYGNADRFRGRGEARQSKELQWLLATRTSWIQSQMYAGAKDAVCTRTTHAN